MADSPAPHIGTLSEKSLHAGLKVWYAQPGDEFEVKLGRFVIDIMRGDQLIEIQTRHLYAMKRKLKRLLDDHTIHLIHPIAREKWIVRQTAEGEAISRRKSPKKGRVLDLFNELMRMPELALHPNLTLEVALTQQEEIWVDDGQGSWRRKHWSVADHRLLSVVEQHQFANSADFLAVLPADLARPFTNKQLAKALRCPARTAQRITYTLRRMQLLDVVGKAGNANLMTEIRSN